MTILAVLSRTRVLKKNSHKEKKIIDIVNKKVYIYIQGEVYGSNQYKYSHGYPIKEPI
jgi:hypothetical protein